MYYSEIALTDAAPRKQEDAVCEYRSPQLDNGTGQGLLIPCRNKAAMWTDRGLRCEEHQGD